MYHTFIARGLSFDSAFLQKEVLLLVFLQWFVLCVKGNANMKKKEKKKKEEEILVYLRILRMQR